MYLLDCVHVCRRNEDAEARLKVETKCEALVEKSPEANRAA